MNKRTNEISKHLKIEVKLNVFVIQKRPLANRFNMLISVDKDLYLLPTNIISILKKV